MKSLLVSLFVLVTLLMSFVVSSASAAWIQVIAAKPVCFVEEVGQENELIVFQYTRRMNQAGGSNDYGLRLEVYSPLSKYKYVNRVLDKHSQILSFQTYKKTAGYSTPGTPELGEYEICLSIDGASSGMFGGVANTVGVQIEVLIDHRDRRKPLSSADDKQADALRKSVKSGEEIFLFTDDDGQVKESLRTHDYIDRVSQHIRTISNNIDNVVDEAKYFVQRQGRMRLTSETSFTRIWVFSVVSMCLVTAVSLLQFFSLKSFLMGKKLI